MKTLIKKATEKGFEGEVLLTGLMFKKGFENLQPLWLYDLRQWLFDTHKIWINIFIDTRMSNKGICWGYTKCDCASKKKPILYGIRSTYYKSPQHALEVGLSEALNLINQ